MPSPGSWGALSNDLLLGGVLSYSVAMLGFAADFAFSREAGPAGQSARPEPIRVPAAGSRVLVGAGSTAGATATGSTAAGSTGSGTPGSIAAGSPARGLRAAGSAAGLPPDLIAGGGDRRSRRLAREEASGPAGWVAKIALALTVVGWALHVGSVVARGFAARRVPWGNMYEFSSMVALVAVTAFLVLAVRSRVRYLGVFVLLPVVLYLGLAAMVLYVPAGPLLPALNSYWIKIHVVAAISGSGIFMVGGVATVLYLVRDRYETRLAAGRAPVDRGIVRLLPSARALDRMSYRINAFAFPIWTFAVIAGAIWAEAAWGRYWGWDPKETWSFITWVVYACYLHARSTAGWKGRRAAYLGLLGFAALLVDYYAVNIWVSGLHSYSGLS